VLEQQGALPVCAPPQTSVGVAPGAPALQAALEVERLLAGALRLLPQRLPSCSFHNSRKTLRYLDYLCHNLDISYDFTYFQ